MTVISSIASSIAGNTYVPSARNGLDTVKKDIENSEAERSTSIDDKDGKYVKSIEQDAQIGQLKQEIESKEQETKDKAKSEDELSRLEQQLADLIEKYSKNPPNIKFSHSETSNGQVIDVIDSKTEETIRQIPSEEAIAIRERLHELNDMYTRAKGKVDAEYSEKAKSILLDTKV